MRVYGHQYNARHTDIGAGSDVGEGGTKSHFETRTLGKKRTGRENERDAAIFERQKASPCCPGLGEALFCACNLFALHLVHFLSATVCRCDPNVETKNQLLLWRKTTSVCAVERLAEKSTRRFTGVT